MIDASLPAEALPGSSFRVGAVSARTGALLSRNLPMFLLISTVANVPMSYALMVHDLSRASCLFLGLMLTRLGYAVVLHGAFQDMQSA